MRLGYADPPYPGQAAKHYADHPDFAGEVDHLELLKRLNAEYEGWALHTSSTALSQILAHTVTLGLTDFRVMAWVKPFAAFKRNVSVAYAWEPVLVKPARKPVVSGRLVMRDWIAEPITLRRGLTGAKPEAVCHWLFEALGSRPEDDLDDLFPGTHAVTKAWTSWQKLFVLPAVTQLELVARGTCECCGEPTDTPPECRDCVERADDEAAKAWREGRE